MAWLRNKYGGWFEIPDDELELSKMGSGKQVDKERTRNNKRTDLFDKLKKSKEEIDFKDGNGNAYTGRMVKSDNNKNIYKLGITNLETDKYYSYSGYEDEVKKYLKNFIKKK